jgi:hypothetical protein
MGIRILETKARRSELVHQAARAATIQRSARPQTIAALWLDGLLYHVAAPMAPMTNGTAKCAKNNVLATG